MSFRRRQRPSQASYFQLTSSASRPVSPRRLYRRLSSRATAGGWRPPTDGSLRLETELTPGEWIRPLLSERTYDVSMTAPRGFEAYVKIFFPFELAPAGARGPFAEGHLPWTELARRAGRVPHALMEKETVTSGYSAHDRPSTCGDLASEQLAVLLPLLARHTSVVEAYFLLWDGYGDLALAPHTPTIRHEMREYYLLSGELRAYELLPDPPGYFWPADRAWCLCGDVDFEWVYVAGSRPLIEVLKAAPVLDAYEVTLRDPAHTGMDVLNDPEGLVDR